MAIAYDWTCSSCAKGSRSISRATPGTAAAWQHADDIRHFSGLQACADIRAVLRFEAVTVFRDPDHMVRVIRRALA
ncbi:hypothetical protein, partial [Streptomyces prasinopilosus]|uniref:hypothetical protein n=1 Tax=Streptomyces prasinopilosus TaxID=67344 RepID=UPI003F5CC0F0